jgi:hypothetical protein
MGVCFFKYFAYTAEAIGSLATWTKAVSPTKTHANNNVFRWLRAISGDAWGTRKHHRFVSLVWELQWLLFRKQGLATHVPQVPAKICHCNWIFDTSHVWKKQICIGKKQICIVFMFSLFPLGTILLLEHLKFSANIFFNLLIHGVLHFARRGNHRRLCDRTFWRKNMFRFGIRVKRERDVDLFARFWNQGFGMFAFQQCPHDCSAEALAKGSHMPLKCVRFKFSKLQDSRLCPGQYVV